DWSRMTDPSNLFWPASQLGEAINALARKSGLSAGAAELPGPFNASGQQSSQWIEAAADRLGFEAEEVGALYGEVELMLLKAGPALLRVPQSNSFLAVLGSR